ncbi:MAG: hypothetical protein GY854_02960 [Deltaproteobacteria bacterium]|nr:hypothetical protein [Deltaproteobacteria bacterium]
MLVSRLLVIASMLVFSCAVGPRTPATNASSQAASINAEQLSERMTALSKTLTSQGFSPTSWTQTDHIDADTVKTYNLRFDKQKRVVLVAIGDNFEMNLDVALTDSSGTLVSRDRTAAVRAVFEWVADADEDYELEVRARKSNGQFLLQAFSAPPATPPARLIDLFDADPAKRGTRTWDAVHARMHRMNYKPESEPKRLRATNQDRLVLPARLTGGRCYMFTALGSAGIDTIEMRLEAHHNLLVADLAGRPEAWVKYCAEENLDARLIIIVVAGSGSVLTGSFAADRKDIAKEVGPELQIRDVPLGHDVALRLAEQRLEKHGYGQTKTVFEKEIAPGDRAPISLSVEPGRCGILYAVGDPVTTAFDIEVFEGKKPLTVIKRTTGSVSEWGVCSGTTENLRIEIVALTDRVGVIARFKSLPEVNLSSLIDKEIRFLATETAAHFGRAGMTLSNAPVPMESSTKTSYHVEIGLDGGRCYGLAAVAPFPIDRLAARTVEGKEVGAWSGPRLSAEMALCPANDDTYEITATVEHPASWNSQLPTPNKTKEEQIYFLLFASDIPR